MFHFSYIVNNELQTNITQNNQMDILESLEPLLKMFWYVAVPSSLIFIIQTVMSFIGLESSHNMDFEINSDADFNIDSAEHDSHFQLFSLRNLINFLLGFSWTGISFYSTIAYKPLLILMSFIVGCLFVYIFIVIINQALKLSEDNTFNLKDAIGKTAEVYLTIPGERSGNGKIMVSVKGSYHELEAMTENEKILSGTIVRVIYIDEGDILIVEEL